MRYINTEGIILRKKNCGEHDQFVTIFSPELGTVEGVARGARKITSPFMGHLEVLNLCRFQLYRSAVRYTITQCQSEQTFREIRKNLEHSLQGLLVAEIFQKTAHSEEHGHELLSLLKETLNHLGKAQKNRLAIEHFKIRLLTVSGSMPDISRCSGCHRRWEEQENIYTDRERHIFCASCAAGMSAKEHIHFDIMKLIHFMSREPFEKVKAIRLKEEHMKEIKKITGIFLEQAVTHKIHSENWQIQSAGV